MKNNNIYVHTIRGSLAFYVDGEQICFISEGDMIGVSNLKTIRKQQKLSHAWRKSQGLDFNERDYGYHRIKINPECLK